MSVSDHHRLDPVYPRNTICWSWILASWTSFPLAVMLFYRDKNVQINVGTFAACRRFEILPFRKSWLPLSRKWKNNNILSIFIYHSSVLPARITIHHRFGVTRIISKLSSFVSWRWRWWWFVLMLWCVCDATISHSHTHPNTTNWFVAELSSFLAWKQINRNVFLIHNNLSNNDIAFRLMSCSSMTTGNQQSA